jgi:hypothetical protein
MNRFLPLALATFALAPFSIAQATEILRWERLPLALPLVVDQERVVFVARNVRVGVPASLGNRLRVQSAAGAIYLLASEPIEPTRLQLQDADTGTVICSTSPPNLPRTVSRLWSRCASLRQYRPHHPRLPPRPMMAVPNQLLHRPHRSP